MPTRKFAPDPGLTPSAAARAPGAGGPRRGWRGAVLAGGGFCAVAAAPAADRAMIVNPDVVWTMPSEERTLEYPLLLEGRVNFVDRTWRNLWIEHDGIGSYLPMEGPIPGLVEGSRVRIEGTYVPAAGLSAARIKITVLDAHVPAQPLATAGRISEIRAFDRRMVVTEAYVDEQLAIDAEHLRLHLIVDDRSVIGWVRPDDDRRLPQWTGKFVRLEALYSGRLDPSGTQSTVELWVGRESAVSVVGAIASSPRFELPRTPVNRLQESAPGTVVKVRGQLRARESGASVVVRDDAGEVLVESLQRERVPAGTEIEAVGRIDIAGGRWVLRDALFRRAGESAAAATVDARAPLRTVDRIRQLSAAEAAQGRPVDISGLVVWSLPEADFFYLQDLSGGVRVRLAPGQKAPPLQKAWRVEGVTMKGELGAAVQMRRADDLGSMAHPPARRISVAQALSGAEEGQWVALRGFIQRTVSDGDWRWVHVTGPDGPFIAHLQSPVDFVATPGSLIRVQGVCEATLDPRGRVSGVLLRTPFLHDFTIEEDAPSDPFDLPLRTLAHLRSLRAQPDMLRVRVAGVVTQRAVGESLVIQDGPSALLVQSRATTPVRPGETIEAVGILGREGARTVLREAEYRPVAARPAPVPVALESLAEVAADFDARLVRVRGRLIDVSRFPGRTRLTLQHGNTFFDALVEHADPAAAMPVWREGTVLEVTGLCRLEFDDTQRVHGVAVAVRSVEDLAVLAPAPFWSVERLGWLVAALGAATTAIVGCVLWLRLRVRKQAVLLDQQSAREARLAAELERTQRLHSLGSLAGGIAHDFNNLLTGILGNVSFAMLNHRAMALVGESLTEAEAGAKRARELTQQMITFAQGGEPSPAPVALPPLVHGVVTLALSGAPARVEFHPPADLWPVLADTAQFGRALHSVLVHARHLRPEGGTLPLHAANETVHENGALAPGRYVRLTLEVTGVVVPAERLTGYFDPYGGARYGDDRFTLAIAWSIVKRHGGHLDVRSTAGSGTLFRLWLPAADPAALLETAAAAVPAVPPPTLAGVRVLVMDDESIIRRLTERYLRELKCEARSVADGRECLHVYAEAMRTGRPFQAVVLDLTVPGGMGGQETLAELKKLDPGVRAIVSSGYFNDPVMARFREHGFLECVPKPYAVDELSAALKRMLAG